MERRIDEVALDLALSYGSTDVSPSSRSRDLHELEENKQKCTKASDNLSSPVLPPHDEEQAKRGRILRSHSITVAPIGSTFVVSALHDVDSDTEDLELPHLEVLRISRKNSKSDILAPAQRFSEVSNIDKIKSLCLQNVEGWQKLHMRDLVVDQLMAGLSNQLFKVSLLESVPDRSSFHRREVLFRIYGKDVDALYDSATEVRVFKTLSEYGFAPTFLGGFPGGRIEEWIYGAVLVTKDMMLKTTMVGVATVLAEFHEMDLSSVISTTPVLFPRLKSWSRAAWNLYKTLPADHPNMTKFERLDLPRLMDEAQRLPQYLFGSSMTLDEVCAVLENPSSAAFPAFETNVLTKVAFCHNDIQENNVMLTANSAAQPPVLKNLAPLLRDSVCKPDFYMRLIDFEYAAYSYPAYDLASYFWETTCDYNHNEYPFYKITPEAYPSISERRRFLALYLSHRLNKHVSFNNKAYLDPMLDTIERFVLANSLFWGFWSVIRAGQAPTGTTEFDMLLYAQTRFSHYWEQKLSLGVQETAESQERAGF